MKPPESDIPDWVKSDGPDSDVVISTRARLARSLAQYPFPSRASGEDLTMIVREVRQACSGLTERFPGVTLTNVDTLSVEAKNFLLDAHLASIEQIKGGKGRALVLEPRARLSIMINEEDHLRLQVIMSGLVCAGAWEMVDWVDDVLAENLDFGFSSNYGYLTASLSNAGTGLRISAMMHLAGMRLTKKLNTQLKAAYDLGVSVRGVFGEGTQSFGDFFQVSNEVTLGLSEQDIVERVTSVTQYLLKQERLARKELLSRRRVNILHDAAKALRTLQSSICMLPQEAFALMSSLRLANSLGFLENGSGALMNELLAGMRVGAGNDKGAGIERATLLRNKLAGLYIKDN